MDSHQLPEIEAAERYCSLFVQEDEPLENLRPKKTNPFEEYSSSGDEDSETEPPQPPVRTTITKPPMIFTRPVYGSQYKASPPTSTMQRTPISARSRAEDIQRAGDVLNAAWRRRTTSQSRHASKAMPQPLAAASATTSESGEYTAPPADTARARTALQTLSPRRNVSMSNHSRLHPPRKPQRSRETAYSAPRQLRVAGSKDITDATGNARDSEMMEAGNVLLSLYNAAGDEGGV